MKKKIAITMGEPGGIGPEIIVKSFTDPEIKGLCSIVLVGDRSVIKEAINTSKLALKIRSVSRPHASVAADNVEIIDIQSKRTFIKCSPSKDAGRAVVTCIKKAVELALDGEVDGIVTAPISKKSLSMAGYSWPGHTELLADLTGSREFAMMFVSRKLKLILCTIHLPLKEVARKITKEGIAMSIKLASRGAEMLGISNPRIAVAGLNPHAGESGVMGKEERKVIVPAVEKMRKAGVEVTGPYPPDVIFHKAYKGEFDIVVCMYHDQGLIPFKMVAFDTGVNMTVGLPIIRTSPDHGTAFDIAWQNRADPSSMIEAIKLAATVKSRVMS